MMDEPMVDAMGRAALAKTVVVGVNFEIVLCAKFSGDEEASVSIYHEVLEGAAVAAPIPPKEVCEMNEADFESAARKSHFLYGTANPTSLNEMLESFGF